MDEHAEQTSESGANGRIPWTGYSYLERATALEQRLEAFERLSTTKKAKQAPELVRLALTQAKEHAAELDSLRARLEAIVRHLEGRHHGE